MKKFKEKTRILIGILGTKVDQGYQSKPVKPMCN